MEINNEKLINKYIQMLATETYARQVYEVQLEEALIEIENLKKELEEAKNITELKEETTEEEWKIWKKNKQIKKKLHKSHKNL